MPLLAPPRTAQPAFFVGHERQRLLLRWLDAAWFPWAWMALWAAVQAGHALVSWHFFADGAALLRSAGPGAGLHLYATHPQLQIGPLTFLAATPLDGLPAWLSGSVAAAAIAATGPAISPALRRSSKGTR